MSNFIEVGDGNGGTFFLNVAHIVKIEPDTSYSTKDVDQMGTIITLSTPIHPAFARGGQGYLPDDFPHMIEVFDNVSNVCALITSAGGKVVTG